MKISEIEMWVEEEGSQCWVHYVRWVQEREGELLRLVEGLAPQHRVRPSMLRPLLSAVGLTLGAASSMLPKKASSAISGASSLALLLMRLVI
jgi:demethoxyubiquinone hydroxylase (CLK1/Coq7/Cat5 family)